MPTYEVTCTVGGYAGRTPGSALDRVLDTTASMREEGVEIIHDEVVVTSDREKTVTEMRMRFEAPTEGIVGWHMYRANLPACGIRRVSEWDSRENDRTHASSVEEFPRL